MGNEFIKQRTVNMNEKYIIEQYNHTKNDFNDVWKIESQYFNPKMISPVSQVINWDRKNKDIHIFVKDKNTCSVVGEVTLLPLTKKQYENFITSKLEDTDIDEVNLINYEDEMECYLLFSAIAIDLKYRNDRRVLSNLLKGLIAKINSLQERGIVFKNMCAEAITSDGSKFIKGFLDLKEVTKTNEGYTIYSFNDKNDMDKWLKIFPSYIKEYDLKTEKINMKLTSKEA